MNITQMQVGGYTEKDNKHCKWFFDNIPNPLPERGDFINTRHSTYYVIEDDIAVPRVDTLGAIIQITSRLFTLTEDNEWIVQYSGE